MKIKTTILAILLPFVLPAQECDYFPLDTLNVCGYEFDLDFVLDENTISYDCMTEQYLSISFDTDLTELRFSSCGIYSLVYNATDGSCIDTLLIQVSDPNSALLFQTTDIGLGYGDIDCPSSATADCSSNSVSIPIGTGTPTPIWSFCSTTNCISSIYNSETIGSTSGCLADSIMIDTISIFSTSDLCSDTTQNAFIILNSLGDTVTDNNFLEYLAQLQSESDLDCLFNGQECSFSNIPACYDSIAMDTTILPIPVRIGGQWTMPMIDTLQLYDTTYFTYFSIDYELILHPGVDFYGPGNLDVALNEIYISSTNDTTRQIPIDFYLTLQWEEEWIIDTITLIKEVPVDTDDDCFTCGGFASGSSLNVPDIPAFPCGPVGIYFPSYCECSYQEPDYAIQQINCEPRIWDVELLSDQHFIDEVMGADAVIDINNADISNPTSQDIQVISYDIWGCTYYTNVYLDDYVDQISINGSGDLSCEVTTVNLNAFGNYYFSNQSANLSSTIWNGGQFVGSSITVTSEGSYTASFTDENGCNHTASYYVLYDETVDCEEEETLTPSPSCDEIEEEDILCDIMSLNTANNEMPDENYNYNNQPEVLCDNGGAPHNISWVSFVAYDGDYSINILPSGCFGSNNGVEGIQVGLYDNCSYTNSAFCNADCSTNNVAIPSIDLVPGQVYNMFIDGCSGSVCNYEVEVIGNPEEPDLAPESIEVISNGEAILNADNGDIITYCAGASIFSQLSGVEIEGEYSWSVSTLEGGPYEGPTSMVEELNYLNLSFGIKGTYKVCINEINNGCEKYTWNGNMCFTVKIDKTDDEDFGIQNICNGELLNFDATVLDNMDPNEDGNSGLQVINQSFQVGNNSLLATDHNGCEYQQEIEIEEFPESQRGLVDIVMCKDDLPLMIDEIQVTELNFAGALNFDLDNYLLANRSDQNGCDSTIDIKIEMLDLLGGNLENGACTSDGIIMTFDYLVGLSTNAEYITFEWFDPSNTPLPDDIWETGNPLSNLAPVERGSGTYTLIASISKEGKGCTFEYAIDIDFESLIPPTPNISGPGLDVCPSDNIVSYSAIDFGNASTFNWNYPSDINLATLSGAMNEILTIDWTGSEGGSITLNTHNGCAQSEEIEIDINVIAQPILSLELSPEVCTDSYTTIEFMGDATDINTFEWDFDGGILNSGNGFGPYTIAWETDGIKNITLTTSNIYGCSQIVASEIMVNEVPLADFSVPTDSICVTEQLILNPFQSGQNLIHDWDFDGATNVGTGDPILIFDTPGWKTITLTIDNGNCKSEQATQAIFVESKMEEIELTCMEQGLHSLLLGWEEIEGADGYLISIEDQPVVQVLDNTFFAEGLDENTTYSIQISVITDKRCPPPATFSSCKTDECLSLDFTFEVPEKICIDENMELVELVASSADATVPYTWAGQNIAGTTFDPNGLTDGIYTFEVTHQVEDCISKDEVSITLVAPPSFELTYDEIVCYGEEFATLELTTSDLSNTILIEGEAAESVSSLSIGMHEIVVMNNDQCSTTESIFIEETEETNLSIEGALEIKEGESHNYSLLQDQLQNIDITTLLWMINGEEYCQGSECLFINPTLNEDSEIEISALNINGCEVLSKIRILVEQKAPKLFIPNTFSPNGDGLNDSWFVVKNKEDIQIQTITILDRWSNLVFVQNQGLSETDMKWDGRFNGSELQPGVYIYSVTYTVEDKVETMVGDVTIVK